MDKLLLTKLIQIEEKFIPLKKYLEKYSDYKGMISIQSKISSQPEILFLGINPGIGAFCELNYDQEKVNLYGIRFPNRLLSNEYYLKNLDLDWFKDNNARHAKWYEKAKIKNVFPKQMIEILLNFSEIRLGKRINVNNEDERKLFMKLVADKVVYSNICPIATKSTKELKSIYKKLANEYDLKNIWNGTIQNFFRQRTIDLILALKPKLIVCAGNFVYKDLFLKDTLKNVKVFSSTETIKRQKNNYKFEVLTFSRKGTWDVNKISQLIVENSYKIISQQNEININYDQRNRNKII